MINKVCFAIDVFRLFPSRGKGHFSTVMPRHYCIDYSSSGFKTNQSELQMSSQMFDINDSAVVAIIQVYFAMFIKPFASRPSDEALLWLCMFKAGSDVKSCDH